MSAHIRNFCIIAHIDHGKSTLADRLLEITGTLDKRTLGEQTLDSMDLEKERGITIKLAPVRMAWKGCELNLIDTPGHVDFQYEVSRSLASVEGAVLVVDATQGIEAQTLSNVYLALENDLAIIPVLNKIDLPSADVERVTEEVVNLLGCSPDDIIAVSAKTGMNVESLLDAVVERVPAPKRLASSGALVAGDDPAAEDDSAIKGLIFDSQYDPYKGVVIYVKLFSGQIKRGTKLELLHAGSKMEVLEVGTFRPKMSPTTTLDAGQIGYVVTGLKSVSDAKVGDTLYAGDSARRVPIAGFRRITPFIFAGIYPVDTDEYVKLRDALSKLTLNDDSLTTENEISPALGHGFRCGFLGLLHLDIVRERILREFDVDVIMTSPQVTYRVVLAGDKTQEYTRFLPEAYDDAGTTKTRIIISNPDDLPKSGTYMAIEEPIARVDIICPSDYVGACMTLAQERRGSIKNQSYLDRGRIMLSYEIPMAELVGDFYDDLKSLSSGYASMSYEFAHYREDDLVKVDFLVAGEPVDAFSLLTHRDKARTVGQRICGKLKEHIPKAQFSIALQAVIGATIIAREDISALRKDVTAKLYG